jgi:dihydrofolate reductase
MWPFLTSWFERADALLLGRKTWEIWEPYRPLHDSGDPSHGSGELLRWLLERDLVNELNLRIYPVVVGDGLRLFPERGQTHALALVESRSTPKSVMIQTYRPAGRATFGTAGE